MLKKDLDRYPQEPPQLPEYDISPSLKKLVLTFMGIMLLNFVIAGVCAIGMRIIQIGVPLIQIHSIPQNVLFYALLKFTEKEIQTEGFEILGIRKEYEEPVTLYLVSSRKV